MGTAICSSRGLSPRENSLRKIAKAYASDAAEAGGYRNGVNIQKATCPTIRGAVIHIAGLLASREQVRTTTRASANSPQRPTINDCRCTTLASLLVLQKYRGYDDVSECGLKLPRQSESAN